MFTFVLIGCCHYSYFVFWHSIENCSKAQLRTEIDQSGPPPKGLFGDFMVDFGRHQVKQSFLNKSQIITCTLMRMAGCGVISHKSLATKTIIYSSLNSEIFGRYLHSTHSEFLVITKSFSCTNLLTLVLEIMNIKESQTMETMNRATLYALHTEDLDDKTC